MSIAIPWTRIAGLALRPLLFSGNQEGSLGGPTLPVPRIGDRFAADVETAQFRQDDVGRAFVGALFQASTLDARIAIYQPALGAATTRSAAIVVDGGGQAGSTLALRGLYPAQAVRYGQFFNVVHLGCAYVYMAAASVAAGTDGRLALPIWPMLRALTVDGEPCNFATPVIEGQLVGFDKGAKLAGARVEPLSFSILERA